MRTLGIVAALCGLCACRSHVDAEHIRTWGSMREVMREGKVQGRVQLASVLTSEHVVGIGALAGLRGEIAIVDGVAWVARIDAGKLTCSSGARSEDAATLLAVDDVAAWTEMALDADTSAAEFEALLARLAERSDLRERRAWPFVVEGEFTSVDAHVLNGQCPFAGEVDLDHKPVRRSFERVQGTLVGFFAPNSEGDLVHHGQATHMHLVHSGAEPFVGHVDRADLVAGVRLRIPAAR